MGNLRSHGPSGYNQGCRCEVCREAQRLRSSKRPKPPPKVRKIRVRSPEEMVCRIDGCETARSKRSTLCSMHLARKNRHGDPLFTRGRQIPAGVDPWTEAFINRYVVTAAGCWEWTGHRNAAGYGKRSWKNVKYYAHRQSYTLAVGPIPDDMTVDHMCFNPSCINPAHLRVLTMADNVRHQRRRLSPTCSRGHSKAEHYISRPSGSPYCGECQRELYRAKRASA